MQLPQNPRVTLVVYIVCNCRTDYNVTWYVYNPLFDFEAEPVGPVTVLFNLYSTDAMI